MEKLKFQTTLKETTVYYLKGYALDMRCDVNDVIEAMTDMIRNNKELHEKLDKILQKI
jgi:hypothetical protein